MNPEGAKNTLLNSDYPIDKIIGYSVGSQTVSGSSFPDINVPHGFGFKPLFYIKWSTTPDFSISYEETGISFNQVSLNGYADNTNIVLIPFNNTLSSVTFYYRIIYFMPSNIDVSNAQTQSSFDDFVINTDYNYTKIFSQGISSSSSVTIDHNLGYYPQVEVWYERSDGRLIHLVDNYVSGSTERPQARVTTSQLILTNGGLVTSVVAWHYKIYLDEV